MTPIGRSRRAWRWAALGSLTVVVVLVVALFVALAVDRRTPKEQKLLAEVRRITVNATGRGSPSRGDETPPNATVATATDKLCGVSGSDLVRSEAETVEQHVARLTEKAIARWRTGLLESADRKQHAMGLALQNASGNPTPAPYTPYQDRDTPSNNELVLLATESDDPEIYAVALGQCGDDNLEMAAGPCQGLSLEHWARIDPDNALPWIWIAARANRLGNKARTDEALSRAAHASRLKSYLGEMSAVALDALPRNVSPLEKAAAGANLLSISRLGTPFALLDVCSEEVLESPTRKDQCSSVAKLMAAQGSTIIEVGLTVDLGRHLGWPADQLTAFEKEFRSYVRAWVYPWGQADPGHGFECAQVLRYDAFIDQLAAYGNERAAMKATIKLTGAPNF